MFLSLISARYRQSGDNPLLEVSVLRGYCAISLDWSGRTEVWAAQLRNPNKPENLYEIQRIIQKQRTELKTTNPSHRL